MNQLAERTERLPMDSVGMSTGATGAKIAPQNLAEVVKFAEVMCRADIALPKHLRGNAGACMAVALQALDWQMNPFAVASKSYQVNGTIAYEAQLIAAVVNTRSGIKGRLRYRYDGTGNDMTCTVSGILDGEEFSYTSPPVGLITPKNSPLWKTDQQQQLGYYSARSWARRYTPEVILGVYDREEAEQFQGPDNARDITPQPSVMQRLRQNAAQQPEGSREGFDSSFVHSETESALTGEILDDYETTNPGASPSPDADAALSPASSAGVTESAPSSVTSPIPDASETRGGSASGDDPAGGEITPSQPPAGSPLIDCAREMLALTVMSYSDHEEREAALRQCADEWKDKLPYEREKVSSIFISANAVASQKRTLIQARSFLAGVLDCNVEDLESANG
ncbi:recombinase RecT [Rhizobium phaseoli]|uniref:RecT family protein n=1 Tax=Rhizobium phaseoli TaxID=396 RepID=A0ABM6C8T3_9HYPH|nr:recombinase RecT [Rhizobium phaseoli]ANL84623.1 RecT family protein [Rhizobium phaseoli]ANL91130.1 RecT family protein [Rhizobium phaseoli]